MSAPEVKRYIIAEEDGELMECGGGDGVLYADYEQAIRERDEARAALRQALEVLGGRDVELAIIHVMHGMHSQYDSEAARALGERKG